MSKPSSTVLSDHDANVLNALFDPESSLSSSKPMIDVSLCSLPHIEDQQLRSLQRSETDIVKALNTPTPTIGAIKSALQSLDKLIEQNPSYASAYTNRAQANRLLQTQTGNSNLTESILTDLSKAISLATPESSSTPLSTFQAKVLSAAHTHRAYLLYGIARSERENGTCLASLQKLSNEELEDMASHDFFMGGQFGDKVAQQMSVYTNPYAKMCGAIVKEAMKEEMKEYNQSRSVIS